MVGKAGISAPVIRPCDVAEALARARPEEGSSREVADMWFRCCIELATVVAISTRELSVLAFYDICKGRSE